MGLFPLPVEESCFTIRAAVCETILLGQLYIQQIRYRILLNPCNTVLDAFLIWKALSSEPSIQDTELQVLMQNQLDWYFRITTCDFTKQTTCTTVQHEASLQVLNLVRLESGLEVFTCTAVKFVNLLSQLPLL